MDIVILGPQGSGKDTQSDRIARELNLGVIHMGQFLRGVAKQDTPLGKEVYHYQNVLNEMVPSKILKQVLHMKIASFPREQGIIFEGIPRTMDQAEYFDAVLQEFGRDLDAVIVLEVSLSEAVKRITKRRVCEKCKKVLILGKDIKKEDEECPGCGGKIIQRMDDTEKGVRKRLEVFKEETIPVLKQYKKQNKVLEVDGNQTIEKVTEDILTELKKINDTYQN